LADESDLNCGCPKPFSTHAGMGAALLSTPDILIGILDALLKDVDLPISCKIRLLPTQEETLLLVARILQTGIRNLTVHCRTRSMRPGERALWERLGEIVTLGNARDIPVICNGDGSGWENWAQIRKETGACQLLAKSDHRRILNHVGSGG
jgi:tRNA-dihydrouridine synthase 2